jgi:hypothetical protein
MASTSPESGKGKGVHNGITLAPRAPVVLPREFSNAMAWETDGRGLHSSSFQLNLSLYCSPYNPTNLVHCPVDAQVEP